MVGNCLESVDRAGTGFRCGWISGRMHRKPRWKPCRVLKFNMNANQNPNKRIITGELFGMPLDVEVSEKVEGDTITTTAEYYLPQMAYDAKTGILHIVQPHRMASPFTDRELREMRLMGLL